MLWVGVIIAVVQNQWAFLPSVLVGALVGEGIWWWVSHGGLGGAGDPRGYWLLAFLVPVSEFLVYDAMVEFQVGGLAWPLHLWAGAPFMAGLYSTLIAVLIVPPRFLASGSPGAWPHS
jgi:hypothetical protein